MRFHHTRLILPIAAALALGACSQDKSAEEAAAVSEATAPSSNGEMPDVSRSAPGVAFSIDYSFGLPANRIASVQQAHADACGALGVDRCRVTGIDFNQVGEDDATGRLDLLLAPELAFRFGNEAGEIVKQAEGSIEEAQVNGEDAGARIDASHRTDRALKDEVARIEARLATRGLTKESRTDLEARLQELRRELAAEAEVRTDAERSLATTPVTLTYTSQGLLSGGQNPFTGAAKASLGSMNALLSVALIAGGAILPWALLIGLLVLGWRRWRRRVPAATTA